MCLCAGVGWGALILMRVDLTKVWNKLTARKAGCSNTSVPIHSRLLSLVYYSHPLHTHSSAVGSFASFRSLAMTDLSQSRHFGCAWNHFSHASHCSHGISVTLPGASSFLHVEHVASSPPPLPRLRSVPALPLRAPLGEAAPYFARCSAPRWSDQRPQPL